MRMKSWPAGLILLSLVIGLTSCAGRQNVLPPQIQTTTVVKRVSLPAECFRHTSTEIVARGDTNEDLARDYRDNLDAVIEDNARKDECSDMNGKQIND